MSEVLSYTLWVQLDKRRPGLVGHLPVEFKVEPWRRIAVVPVNKHTPVCDMVTPDELLVGQRIIVNTKTVMQQEGWILSIEKELAPPSVWERLTEDD